MSDIKGYIDRKSLIKIAVITLGALVSTGALTTIADQLIINSPDWFPPIVSVGVAIITFTYNSLKKLDSGEDLNVKA